MHTPVIAASVVLSAALFASAVSFQPQPEPSTGLSPVLNPLRAPAPTPTSDTSCQLHQDMRKLWTDHTVWTRDYIIAAVDDKPDAKAAGQRLMKNQEDIGAAVAMYYGEPNGEKLTALLKDHIQISTEVIKAAKGKDDAALKEANARWERNAGEIADFLGSANPNWPRATMNDMMMMHLSTTTDEVKARLSKDWDKDVKAYDAVYDHILKMSDALSDGIVKQFPDKFGMPRGK